MQLHPNMAFLLPAEGNGRDLMQAHFSLTAVCQNPSGPPTTLLEPEATS